MTDDLRALIADAYTRRADSVEAMRTPSQNSPFAPVPQRPERRGQKKAHRDPTGDRAVGNIRRQEKKKR